MRSDNLQEKGKFFYVTFSYSSVAIFFFSNKFNIKCFNNFYMLRLLFLLTRFSLKGIFWLLKMSNYLHKTEYRNSKNIKAFFHGITFCDKISLSVLFSLHDLKFST